MILVLQNQQMHNSKSEKKLTLMTKTMQGKKPNLEINTNSQIDPGCNSMPTGFSNMNEDSLAAHYKSVSTVTSPTNKNLKAVVEITEPDDSGKKKYQPINMAKKVSGKELHTPKADPPAKISANLVTSPKAALNKDKIVISYGSEKNMGPIKAVEKKETPQSKQHRIEQLQREIQDERIKSSALVLKQNQLSLAIGQLKTQNQHLKEENNELKKKVQKYKALKGETKQLLKERINHFNEEGGELQAIRTQIKTLEARVQALLSENLQLKSELNKVSDYNLQHLKSLSPENMAVSQVKQIVPLKGSRVSSLYLKDAQGDFKEFSDIQNVEENLDLQSYISQKEETYLQQYKENVSMFNVIKKEYEQILSGIQAKYKKLVSQLEEKIAAQAAQLYEIELRNDELNEKVQESLHGSRCSQNSMTLDWDQAILRKQQENAKLTLDIYDLKEQGKELVEQCEHLRAQYQFLQAELEVQRMKKKFKNENDKFQFNVTKLNLLNIIDKLKMQVDIEKKKSQKQKEALAC